MDKTTYFACPNPKATFSKGIETVRAYYETKGYKVSESHNQREAEFFFTKDSLYRKLVRKVPVIVGQWMLEEDRLRVRVFTKMEHGNGALDSVVGKAAGVPLGVINAVVHKLTDPMFDEAFSEEFMLLSEAAADADRHIR